MLSAAAADDDDEDDDEADITTVAATTEVTGTAYAGAAASVTSQQATVANSIQASSITVQRQMVLLQLRGGGSTDSSNSNSSKRRQPLDLLAVKDAVSTVKEKGDPRIRRAKRAILQQAREAKADAHQRIAAQQQHLLTRGTELETAAAAASSTSAPTVTANADATVDTETGSPLYRRISAAVHHAVAPPAKRRTAGNLQAAARLQPNTKKHTANMGLRSGSDAVVDHTNGSQPALPKHLWKVRKLDLDGSALNSNQQQTVAALPALLGSAKESTLPAEQGTINHSLYTVEPYI